MHEAMGSISGLNRATHSQDDRTFGLDDAPNAHLMAPGAARPLLPLLVPVIADLGFHLVRARMTSEGEHLILQIMAENDAGTIAIEDCEAISHAVSAMLDVEDPISGNYTLEISSPGMGRPLTRPRDFERWAGLEAKVELHNSVDGRRRFRGLVDGFEDGEARLKVALHDFENPQVLGFALADIAEARLVPDDAALRQSLKAGKTRKK
ncbi:MAG: ribosome maturation factor RimP [Pseudomonadota bacterium]|nr:ribosome maturation factor RimP [Pseudomonadota bacterium]